MIFSKSRQDEPDRGATQQVFLSLFFLLLAFFILLNSLSDVEEGKSTKVLQSLQDTFPLADPSQIFSGEAEGTPGDPAAKNLKLKLGQIFAEVLPVAEINEAPGGLPIFVSMPLDDVYSPLLNGVRPEFGKVGAALKTALLETAQGRGLEVQMLTAVRTAPLSGEREVASQAAIAMVERLEALGIPIKRLSAGIEVGDPDRARFVFRQTPSATEQGQ